MGISYLHTEWTRFFEIFSEIFFEMWRSLIDLKFNSDMVTNGH